MFGAFFLLALVSAVFGHYNYVQSIYYDDATTGGIDDIDAGTAYVKIGAKFYIIQAEKEVNWFEAAHNCRRMNADLASIESESEMISLTNYLADKGFKGLESFWLSGNDLASEGKFVWLRTGNSVTLPVWSPGQPDNVGGDENCAHFKMESFQNRFYMHDWICTKNAFYICEAKMPKTVSFNIW